MRLATGLMIIGIVVVGLTATGSVTVGNSSMLVQTNTDIPTLTGSQMSVPIVLANWKGGYHKGWHKGHKGWYGGWYGKWGGYSHCYYPPGRSWRYYNRYCVWDPYTYSWYC